MGAYRIGSDSNHIGRFATGVGDDPEFGHGGAGTGRDETRLLKTAAREPRGPRTATLDFIHVGGRARIVLMPSKVPFTSRSNRGLARSGAKVGSILSHPGERPQLCLDR
jgi:hypothetical protein